MTLTEKEIDQLKLRCLESKKTYNFLITLLTEASPGDVPVEIQLSSDNLTINANYIIKLVEAEFKCEVNCKSRKYGIMKGRHAAVYLLSKYTRLHLVDIGKLVGQSDHTTTINSRKRCQQWMDSDPFYYSDIANLEKTIKRAVKNQI